VPIGDGEAQMVFHALAHDDIVGLVVTEGQRIDAIRAFVFHFLDIAEKSGAHGAVSLGLFLVLFVGVRGKAQFQCASDLIAG
jgi:hypothetical protein